MTRVPKVKGDHPNTPNRAGPVDGGEAEMCQQRLETRSGKLAEGTDGSFLI